MHLWSDSGRGTTPRQTHDQLFNSPHDKLLSTVLSLALSVAITDASAGLALAPNPTPTPVSLPCGRGDEDRLEVSAAPASPSPSAPPPSSPSSSSPSASSDPEPPLLSPLLEFSTSCRSYQESEQNLSCRVCKHDNRGVQQVATEETTIRELAHTCTALERTESGRQSAGQCGHGRAHRSIQKGSRHSRARSEPLRAPQSPCFPLASVRKRSPSPHS